jgi:hypothetical protein
MNRLSPTILALVAAVGLGCDVPETAPADGPEAPGAAPPSGNFGGRIYERTFVFTTLDGDSALLVPWFIGARTRPGGVDRRARGWLLRGSTWEAFYDESWATAPTRAPWRILPFQTLRLIVGESDAVEGVIFSEGARQLDLELTSPLIEWAGARGQTFRVLEAAVYLSDQRIEGAALDMTRARRVEDGALGDWAFLTSGDSLQVVLESSDSTSTEGTGTYHGWARLDFRDLQWPSLTVDWAEVRGFQPSRRDVPVSWTITSEDAGVDGVLQVQSAQIQAGEGTGPLLPVDALFMVSGTLSVDGVTYPVRGLFRHTRS